MEGTCSYFFPEDHSVLFVSTSVLGSTTVYKRINPDQALGNEPYFSLIASFEGASNSTCQTSQFPNLNFNPNIALKYCECPTSTILFAVCARSQSSSCSIRLWRLPMLPGSHSAGVFSDSRSNSSTFNTFTSLSEGVMQPSIPSEVCLARFKGEWATILALPIIGRE